MRFEVYRTSDYWSSTKPCEEAFEAGKNEWNETMFCVEINTIEELMSFIDKYGAVVLKKESIEIYDDYRE